MILLFIASLIHAQDATPSEREMIQQVIQQVTVPAKTKTPAINVRRIRQHIVHLGTLRNSFTASTSLVCPGCSRLSRSWSVATLSSGFEGRWPYIS
jgi:hypothetical protein